MTKYLCKDVPKRFKMGRFFLEDLSKDSGQDRFRSEKKSTKITLLADN